MLEALPEYPTEPIGSYGYAAGALPLVEPGPDDRPLAPWTVRIEFSDGTSRAVEIRRRPPAP